MIKKLRDELSCPKKEYKLLFNLNYKKIVKIFLALHNFLLIKNQTWVKISIIF